MVYVPELPPIDDAGQPSMIPKKMMIPMLEAEAPDFLAELLSLELPPSNDRLNVPVINTSEKAQAELANQTPLQTYLAERTHYVPGRMILFGELFERFLEAADPAETTYYTKHKFGQELPPQHPKGRNRSDGKHYVGNISFEPFKQGDELKPVLKASIPDKNGFVFLDSDRNGHDHKGNS